jgi:hypothetical protein
MDWHKIYVVSADKEILYAGISEKSAEEKIKYIQELNEKKSEPGVYPAYYLPRPRLTVFEDGKWASKKDFPKVEWEE